MRVLTDAGETIELGQTEASPTIGIIDYSRRITDDFGVTTVVARGFGRRMSVRIALPFDAIDTVQRRLADLRATPAQWIADDRYSSLSFRGFYKDFALDLAMPPISYCSLSIEGLVATDAVADNGADPAPDGQASSLYLLQPVTVNDAALAASSVDEADAPEWSPTASYPRGSRVIKAATHRIYEAVAAVAAGDDPAAASGNWLNVGPTNRWAMFDQALGSETTANGSLVVQVEAAVSAVALLDVVGSTVRVQAAGYDRTLPAGPGAVTFLDLPPVASVEVTISGQGAVSLGTLLIGQLVGLGLTEASPSAAITDYSRKEVDDFGGVEVVQRAWAKRMTANALIRTEMLDQVANRIAMVRALPALWIGQAGMDSLTVYGFFKDFSIEVGDTLSKLTLSIEGLSTAGKVAPLIDWADVGDAGGTKPADNATNSADPASALGPIGTVGDALTGIERNMLNQLAAVAESELARLRVRALSFQGPDGEDSYTLLRRETMQRVDADGVFAETFEMLGAVSPNGEAFILNAETVQVSSDETFAQRFTSIATSFADTTASIDHIDEVLAGPDGGAGRALVKVNVNGKVVGTALTNDGTESAFIVAVDAFRLEDPDTGKAYLYADDTGKVLMRDVEVDTLKVGTVAYDDLQLGAVQKAAWSTLQADFVVPRGQTLAVWSLPFVKEDTDSALEIQAFINAKSPDDLQFDITIQIDGMVMQAVPGVNLILDTGSSAAQMPITPFVFATGIAAGAHTISVKAYNRETDNVALTIQVGSTLKVVELRKGSIGSSDGSGGAIPPPADGPDDDPGDPYLGGGGGGVTNQ